MPMEEEEEDDEESKGRHGCRCRWQMQMQLRCKWSPTFQPSQQPRHPIYHLLTYLQVYYLFKYLYFIYRISIILLLNVYKTSLQRRKGIDLLVNYKKDGRGRSSSTSTSAAAVVVAAGLAHLHIGRPPSHRSGVSRHRHSLRPLAPPILLHSSPLSSGNQHQIPLSLCAKIDRHVFYRILFP